jgi:hypothetical protein
VDGERTGNADFGQDDFGNRVQVGLSYNLFAGGFTRAKVREVRQLNVELEKRLEELILSTTSDIRSCRPGNHGPDSAGASAGKCGSGEAHTGSGGKRVQRRPRVSGPPQRSPEGFDHCPGNLALALVGLRQAWVELETRTGNILATYGSP